MKRAKIIKCSTLLLLFFVVFTLNLNLLAQTNPVQDAAGDFDRSLQFQQKQLEKERKQKELENFKNYLQQQDEQKKQRQDELNNNQPCFKIDKIEIKGVAEFSEKTLNKWKAPYLNRCLTSVEIQKITGLISKKYQEKGFILARVYLPEQNLNDGTLFLQVVEGKVKNIKVNKNNKKEKRQIKTAFPGVKDKIFNIRDVEQGLDQINRMDGHKAEMDIAASENGEVGESDLIITQKIDDVNKLAFTYDSYGQRSTGKNRASVSYVHNNLLGFNEIFRVSHMRDFFEPVDLIENRNESVFFEVPYGYWTLSLSYSDSDFATPVNIGGTDFISSGRTDTANIDLNRVISRGQNHLTKMGVGFTYKDSESRFAGITLLGPTRALSVGEIFVNHFHRKWGALWNIEFAYNSGLEIFGAEDDQGDLTFLDPRARFDKFFISASVQKPFSLKNNNFTYSAFLNAQYSDDPLYGSEQISIGGPFTVRGYRDDAISGESGAYIQQELSYKIPKEKLLPEKLLSYVAGNSSVFVGFDAGIARRRGGKEVNFNRGKGNMLGAAVGIKYSGQHLNLNFTYAKPIKEPKFINNQNEEFYLRISSSF